MVLRAAVSLKADTVYAVPVAAVAYIDLVVSAELDTSGRFRITFEEFVVVDRPSLQPIKTFVDGVGTADDNFSSVNKALGDSFELSDTIATLLLFLRDFSDSSELADASSYVFTLGTQQETVPVAEARAYSLDKLVHDVFTMDDDADAVDGLQHSIAKGISNVMFAEDDNSLIFNASRVESLGVSDAGLLSMQDYCDFSYFAEDYTGTARNF